MIKVDNQDPWFDWTANPPSLEEIDALPHPEVVVDIRPDSGVVNSFRFKLQANFERAQADLERLKTIHAKLAEGQVLTEDELAILSQATLQNPKPGYNPKLKYVPGDLRMDLRNFRRLDGWWIDGTLEVIGLDKPHTGLVLNNVYVGGDCLISGNTFAYTDMSNMEIEGRWIYRNNTNKENTDVDFGGVVAHGAMILKK